MRTLQFEQPRSEMNKKVLSSVRSNALYNAEAPNRQVSPQAKGVFRGYQFRRFRSAPFKPPFMRPDPPPFYTCN